MPEPNEKPKPQTPETPPTPKTYVVEEDGLPGGRVEVQESQINDYLKTAVRARQIEADAKQRLAEVEQRAGRLQALDYISQAAARNPAGLEVLDQVVSGMNNGLTAAEIRARLAPRDQRLNDDPTDDGGPTPIGNHGPSPDVEAVRREMQGEIQAMRQRLESLQVEGEKKSLLTEVTSLVQNHPSFAGSEAAQELATAQVMSHLSIKGKNYAPKDVLEAVAQRFKAMQEEQANADRQQRDRSARSAPMPTSSSTPGLSEGGNVETPSYKDWSKRGSDARRNFKSKLIEFLETPGTPGAS